MLPHEKLKILKRKKLKGYIPYPVFLTVMWYSSNRTLNMIVITIFVIYILIHQGYFFHKETKLGEVDVGF